MLQATVTTLDRRNVRQGRLHAQMLHGLRTICTCIGHMCPAGYGLRRLIPASCNGRMFATADSDLSQAWPSNLARGSIPNDTRAAWSILHTINMKCVTCFIQASNGRSVQQTLDSLMLGLGPICNHALTPPCSDRTMLGGTQGMLSGRLLTLRQVDRESLSSIEGSSVCSFPTLCSLTNSLFCLPIASMALRNARLWLLFVLTIPINGQVSLPGGFGSHEGSGNDPFDAGHATNPSSSSSSSSYAFTPTPESRKRQRVLIAHAVLACFVWSFFLPLGAILLRLNLTKVNLLRVHYVCQLLSYAIYIAAVALGWWLADETAQYGTWQDVHPRLGLAILAIAFFQPILGYVHHLVYKRRYTDVKAGLGVKKPGRTSWGRIHVWTGRILIVLGITNGGLGIRLVAGSPLQSASATRSGYIAYGVLSGLMFALYFGVSVLFEYRRAARQNTEQEMEANKALMMTKSPPTYAQSQESLQREQELVGRPQNPLPRSQRRSIVINAGDGR